MKRFLVVGFAATIGLVIGNGWARADKSAPAKPATETAACGNHGTSVEFLDSPSEAAQRAKKEQKLVFVLHVSGHFEDPRFT